MSKSNGKPKRAVKSAPQPALKPSDLRAELLSLASLKPHPRNYRIHPDDQLEHIIRSIREHGFYRNVVATRDGTILAGHGVVQAVVKNAWRHFDTPLKLKPGIDLAKLPKIDEHGMRLVEKAAIKSDRVRQVAAEYGLKHAAGKSRTAGVYAKASKRAAS